MLLTISGLPGSGKSTVGKILAEKLNYRYFSMGDFRGQMALKRGLTIDELNKLGEKEEWTDKEADNYQIKLGQTENNIVIEGRLSFHFIPHSFKIFLTADLKEAARRTLENQAERPDEKPARSLEEAERKLTKRLKSDKARYLRYYQLDYTEPENYDLVLDTTFIPAAEVARQILDKIKEKGL
ncbi:MAG: cytidylate kinase family protein [Candidatus Magasanikbacteria bacterium]|nr:cytidylate kinase family protein [Candidatus Magasanikbacteria bacterium]